MKAYADLQIFPFLHLSLCSLQQALDRGALHQERRLLPAQPTNSTYRVWYSRHMCQ